MQVIRHHGAGLVAHAGDRAWRHLADIGIDYVARRARQYVEGRSHAAPQKRGREENVLSRSMPKTKKPKTLKKKSSSKKAEKVAKRAERGVVTADRSAVVKDQKKKRVELKKKKAPHVTSKFKRAVEAALSPDKLKGTYHLITFDSGLDLTTMSADQQVVFDTINNPLLDGGFFFSTDHFNEAVQRLWFGSTAVYNAGFLKPTANGNYNQKKFRVIDSYSTLEYKNNSTRTLTLNIFVCAPKQKGACAIDNPYSQNVYNNQGVTVATQDQILYPPQRYWADALTEDFVQNYSSNGLGAVLPNTTLALTPVSSKTFNAMWKAEQKKIVMLPGTSYLLKLQGPSDLELDYQKFNSDSIYQNVQKFTRGVVTCVMADMTDSSLGGTQRTAPAATSSIKPFLSMERQDHYRIEMPDTLVATGSRRDGYIRAVVNKGTAVGTQEEVTMENPIAYTAN